jgi:hypothetical protein
VRWAIIVCQLFIASALIGVGSLGLVGEAHRSQLLNVARASWTPQTRPTPELFEATLNGKAWQHTSLASSRDVLAAAAWISTLHAAQVRRTGPLDRVREANTTASDRLTALISDGPSHAFAWYLIAEQSIATAGFSSDVGAALRLSYIVGRFDLRAAERRIGLLLRYWPLLKDDFAAELRSDVRVLVFGQGFDAVNSRLAHIGFREAPSQSQLLRSLLGEIKPDYIYWYDYETDLLRKADASRVWK